MVSVHDAALVVANHQVISDFEKNPVGKWLLKCQGNEVWLFVLAKLAGTATACAVLIEIYRWSQRFGVCVAVPLATFQLALLCYLTFA